MHPPSAIVFRHTRTRKKIKNCLNIELDKTFAILRKKKKSLEIPVMHSHNIGYHLLLCAVSLQFDIDPRVCREGDNTDSCFIIAIDFKLVDDQVNELQLLTEITGSLTSGRVKDETDIGLHAVAYFKNVL